MLKTGMLIIALLLGAPSLAMAETISGILDKVSFNKQLIKVDGVEYEVNTDTTRVIYQGEILGEEDLRPGDEIVLHLGNRHSPSGKPVLEAVVLIRGSKSGLDS